MKGIANKPNRVSSDRKAFQTIILAADDRAGVNNDMQTWVTECSAELVILYPDNVSRFLNL